MANRDKLRAALTQIVRSYLSDWESDRSFDSQAAGLVGQLIEAVEETAPRRFIPDNALCLFMDGDEWCCCRGDFVDLQESNAGFGKTQAAAIEDLQRIER